LVDSTSQWKTIGNLSTNPQIEVIVFAYINIEASRFDMLDDAFIDNTWQPES
jgi:hypothetical protein